MKQNNLARLIAAFRYSCQGLRAGYVREPAFRLQVWVVGILSTPLAWLIHDIPLWLRWAITATAALCWVAEILNSAIEALIDYLAPQHHPEAGYIKDLGSAAVMVAVTLWLFTWSLTFFKLNQ